MRLDHVNIRTADLAAMRAWYVETLGLEEGWRPSEFAFPGAWLYAEGRPIVHLVGVAPGESAEGRIEHFAVSSDDPAAFRARMARLGVPVRETAVPSAGIVQMNIRDPDGNHIHVDFPL